MRVTFLFLLFASYSFCGHGAVQAESQGLVTARPCPHSCKSTGLSKKHCRDWRKGNICYVEDLKRKPALPLTPSKYPPTLPGSSKPSANRSSCESLSRADVAPPYISISKAKPSTSGFLSLNSKLRVTGEVEGRCLKEAGIFARGRKIASIFVRTKPEFDRYEFNVRINNEDFPEVRVYNVFGDRAQQEIVNQY